MLSSDQQIPYHDPRAIDLWWKVMKWYKPDVIDYLGDTSDQFCFARFQEGQSDEFLNALKKGPKEDLLPYVQAEEKATGEFYAQTRELRPDAEIFSALGNHDIRAFKYLDAKAPEIIDLVTPESLWGLDSLGIDYIHYNDIPKHRYGDIYVHHGISISKHAGESVRNDVTDLGVSLIRGHSHRMGTFYKTMELRNETLRGYEIGHMCKVDSDGFKYSQIHNWQQGFAYAIISGDQVHVELAEIHSDYSVMVAGKIFKG